MKDYFLAAFSVLASFILVILFILCGWFTVWKLILSRFRFVRELIKGAELQFSRNKLRPRRD